MGQDLYEAFYKNYTIKQWNIDPRKLSVKVAKRIPIYFDKTRSYFKSKFMIMPKNGFTKMFYNMTNSQNIFIRLNTKYKQSMKKKFDIIIYTGPVDLFFNYKFGKLEWRSLDFKFITKKKTFLQDQVQVNYPNNYKYTRTVEYKHITKQKNKYTTISKEYPKSAGEPYYPVDTKRNNLTYKKYLNEIKKLEKRNIFFAGRLAEYTYINTDEAIYKGILLAKKIKNIYYNKR